MISVIMPIYNGEKYLRNSIENIIKQNFIDLEVILVNDGSTDCSLEICKEYAEKDNRIKIIDKPNGGICAARNAGIRVAKGEWLSFADQDDNICDGIYDVFSTAISSNVDMIVAGKRLLMVDDLDNVVSDITYNYSPLELNDTQTILQTILNKNNSGILMHIWNCIYRRETILDNGIFFDERFKYGHEDTLFNAVAALKSRRVLLVSSVVYEYYRRKKSSTSLKKNPYYIDDIRNYLDVLSETIRSKVEWTPKLNCQLYTYSLRLSISLFLAYSNSIVAMTEKKQLEQITLICKRYSNSNKIDISTAGGIVKGIYLSFLNYMLLHNQYKAANRFLNLRRIN